MQVGEEVYAKRTYRRNEEVERKHKWFKGKIIIKTQNFYVVEFEDIKIRECYREEELKSANKNNKSKKECIN